MSVISGIKKRLKEWFMGRQDVNHEEGRLTSCRSPLFSVSRMMASASVVAVASTCSTITCLEL